MGIIHELYKEYINSRRINTKFIEFLNDKNNLKYIDDQDDNKKTVLHLAIANKDFDTLLLLCEKGAKANIKDQYESTAVTLCTRGPDINKRFLEVLIKHQETSEADINEIDTLGKTALHWAIGASAQKVAHLLELGADVNAIDNQGITPFSLAFTNYFQNEEHREILQLLKSGAILCRDFGETELEPGLADDVIVIGSIKNHQPVFRAMKGFEKAITNVEEFDAAVAAKALLNQKFDYKKLELAAKKLIDYGNSSLELLAFYDRVKVYRIAEEGKRAPELTKRLIHFLAENWFKPNPQPIKPSNRPLPPVLVERIENEKRSIAHAYAEQFLFGTARGKLRVEQKLNGIRPEVKKLIEEEKHTLVTSFAKHLLFAQGERKLAMEKEMKGLSQEVQTLIADEITILTKNQSK
jgi:hypothetical protein